jgi:hypothetical protein
VAADGWPKKGPGQELTIAEAADTASSLATREGL